MTAINYLWDPVEQNIVREFDDSGNVIAQYTTEPGLYGDVLSQRRNGQDSYYHYDGRGDTVALTDDSGNVTDTKEYDAWGNVLASTGTTITQYQFNDLYGQDLTVNGVAQAASAFFTVSAADLYTVRFTNVSQNGVDFIQVRAYDGHDWADGSFFIGNLVNADLHPIVSAHDIRVGWRRVFCRDPFMRCRSYLPLPIVHLTKRFLNPDRRPLR